MYKVGDFVVYEFTTGENIVGPELFINNQLHYKIVARIKNVRDNYGLKTYHLVLDIETNLDVHQCYYVDEKLLKPFSGIVDPSPEALELAKLLNIEFVFSRKYDIVED